jgi:hypothetical protein
LDRYLETVTEQVRKSLAEPERLEVAAFRVSDWLDEHGFEVQTRDVDEP